MSDLLTLDETDIAILRILQEDGRITNVELARRVELSPPSVLQRVRRLETQKFIRNYSANLCNTKMGFGLLVFAMVSLTLTQNRPLDRFREAIQKIPQVLECHNISGEFDFILKIAVPDMQEYERLMREDLSAIDVVSRMQSCFVLGTSKLTNCLPI